MGNPEMSPKLIKANPNWVIRSDSIVCIGSFISMAPDLVVRVNVVDVEQSWIFVCTGEANSDMPPISEAHAWTTKKP